MADADRILVMRDGKIAEEGNQATLMRQNGDDASRVQRQTRGMLDRTA